MDDSSHLLNADLNDMQAFTHSCRKVSRPYSRRRRRSFEIAIFDFDGTIANIDHRLPFIQQDEPDWQSFHKACSKDVPKEKIVDLMDILFMAGVYIIIASGRGAEATAETIMWLTDNKVPYHQLYLRPENNITPAETLKKIWYNALWASEDVIGVWEDDDKPVAMWRSMGLQVYQVAEGSNWQPSEKGEDDNE